MRFRRDGLDLNVDIAGDGADAVWLHGLGADARQPAEVFPGDVAFRRVSVECRGHGESPLGNPRDISITTFTDDVIAVIESRLTAPVIIGGISMGAAIALRIAVKRPELVRALVLARPAWVDAAAPDNMRPYGEVGALLADYTADEAREKFANSATASWLAKDGPDNLASLRGFFAREPLQETAALLRRIAQDGPGVSAEDIAKIAKPTLIIAQQQDPLHPVAFARQLATLIGGSQLQLITPKAVNREAYVVDFRNALRGFLGQFEN